jgi:hypothetical protein
MKKIEKDGIYKDANGDYFQLRAGQEMADDYYDGLEFSEAFPEPGQPLGTKAANNPDNKKAAAPDNKSA